MTFRGRTLYLIAFFAATPALLAEDLHLPLRETPIPKTTGGVPHVQIGIAPRPHLSAALLDRVAQFPGVQLGPTQVSLPGAVGFQLDTPLLSRRSLLKGALRPVFGPIFMRPLGFNSLGRKLGWVTFPSDKCGLLRCNQVSSW